MLVPAQPEASAGDTRSQSAVPCVQEAWGGCSTEPEIHPLCVCVWGGVSVLGRKSLPCVEMGEGSEPGRKSPTIPGRSGGPGLCQAWAPRVVTVPPSRDQRAHHSPLTRPSLISPTPTAWGSWGQTKPQCTGGVSLYWGTRLSPCGQLRPHSCPVPSEARNKNGSTGRGQTGWRTGLL